jgi:ankyrin repeat protein
MENLTSGASKPSAGIPSQKYMYDKVLIIGKNIQYSDALKEKSPNTFFIGNGIDAATEEYISTILQKNEEKIDPQATYCVNIHGDSNRSEKGQYEPHNHRAEENTKEIFDVIGKFSQSLLSASPAQGGLTKIILNSCHAGTAQHLDTPKNSLIFARGSQRYVTYTNPTRVISHLDTLHKSIEKFAMALCEGGETCYIIKKEEDKEVQKVRRPKTQEDYQNPQEHFQEQWNNFRKICTDLPTTLPEEFDEDKVQKALNNALLINADRGKVEQTQYALDWGADINTVDDNKNTALHFASQDGHYTVIEELLNGMSEEQRVALINATNNYGSTALHIASFKGHTKIVKLLLENGADIDKVDNNGWTALHVASQDGHDTVVNILLNGMSEEQRVTFIQTQNKKGSTALHIASKDGHHTVVKALLNGMSEEQRDAFIQIQNNNGWTALHVASQNGRYEVVKELLSGMSEEQRDAFIQTKNKKGSTALHVASQDGHDTVVKVLLNGMSEEQRDAFISTKNNQGWTALHLASKMDNIEIVKTLLENGADVKIKTQLGSRPLSFAKYNNNEEMIKLLSPNRGDKKSRHLSK